MKPLLNRKNVKFLNCYFIDGPKMVELPSPGQIGKVLATNAWRFFHTQMKGEHHLKSQTFEGFVKAFWPPKTWGNDP